MHVPGIIEGGRVINENALVTVTCKEDMDFFDLYPKRVYRARPAHPMEIFWHRECYPPIDGHRPAVITKFWRRNGIRFYTRLYRLAPLGIPLRELGDAYLSRIFEPTLH
jgi:hypothetical protein